MDKSYLKRAAEKCGFNRDVFIEKNIPTTHSNVVLFPFLGDLKSMFLLSSIILKDYKENYSSKYLILASWPGYQCLFPYVDEYWSIKKSFGISKLASEAIEYYNGSDVYTLCLRSLNEFFDVVNFEDNRKQGDDIRLFLPAIPSNSILPQSFKEGLKTPGYKIAVYPVRNIKSWQKGKIDKLNVAPDFWKALIDRLLNEGMVPVLYMDHFTFDLSSEFGNKCLYIMSDNMSHAICSLHQVDCILNIFSDIDKLAIISRCPYISVNERSCYLEGKDYEIEDICDSIPRKNIFSFSTHTMAGMNWDINLFDIVIKTIKQFQQSLNRDKLFATSEINEVIPYDKLRKRRSKKMGVRFIKKRPDERIL